MHAIVAIGGGDIVENIGIDRHALGLVNEDPRVLIVSASDADPEEVGTLVDYYKGLDARVSVLDLASDPSERDVRDRILGNNFIFASVRDAVVATAEFRQHRVDRMLAITAQRAAAQVLCGNGDGAGIWFEYFTTNRGVTHGPIELGRGLDIVHNHIASTYLAGQQQERYDFLKDALPLPNRDGETTANAYDIDKAASVVIDPRNTHRSVYSLSSAYHDARLISPRKGKEPHVVTIISSQWKEVVEESDEA